MFEFVNCQHKKKPNHLREFCLLILNQSLRYSPLNLLFVNTNMNILENSQITSGCT